MHYDFPIPSASSPHRYFSSLAFTIQKACLTLWHIANDIAQLKLKCNQYPNFYAFIVHQLS